MFDQSKLNKKFRPKSTGFCRKRPLSFQVAKRVEPSIKFPRQLNRTLPLPFTSSQLNKPNYQQNLTIKPTPTFTSARPVPTFTSYNQPKKRALDYRKSLHLSRPTVRPTRTLNKIVPAKTMLSPRNTPPETQESGFTSQEPTSMAFKTKSVTRQKRKLHRNDDDYRPKRKKRRLLKQSVPSFNYEQTKNEQPNYNWRDKERITVPDIFEITPDQWPEDDGDFEETLADITNDAYYVRHFRAEQREKIFYQKLSKWREKEEREKGLSRKKLRVADRPRGPWQVKLPKSINRGPLHIPRDILEEPKFNYVRKETWSQPVALIRRVVTVEPNGPCTRQKSSGGKDLGNLRGHLAFYRDL